MVCFGQECLIGISLDGMYMYLIDETSDGPHFKILKQYERAVKFFAILNPTGEHLVTINDLNQLNVIFVETGVGVFFFFASIQSVLLYFFMKKCVLGCLNGCI